MTEQPDNTLAVPEGEAGAIPASLLADPSVLGTFATELPAWDLLPPDVGLIKRLSAQS